MEGDGEGLVAIVQGLENSGVTLTVCNRPRQNSDRSRPAAQRIQINAISPRSDTPAVDQRQNTMPAVTAPPALSNVPAVQRSSVETSTGTDFSRMATASQICDGRYASSYKLAHCMVNPTSPPEAVTEFPPQRKEPCRNQGNFEIGGQGSAQWNGHGIAHNVSAHAGVPARVSTSRVRHYGGTQTWADKGSNHRYSKSNHRTETEAFAHSLRKYPSMAPFRTASTDLIEKLIRYTQAKNYQEMSRSTKSMRSLRHQKSSDTYETVRASKHQQTYTRRQDENVTANSNVQVGCRGRARNFKLYSPISDSRNLRENRYRDTTCSSSYDYLKAGNPSNGRSNRSDGSPSPTCSRSPQRRRSPEESLSPDRSQSPDRTQSPEGSRVIRADRSSRTDRPIRFERSVRDLSLSEMSRYIRSTIRQICNERPVVVQVCPKLKDRFSEHRKVCPNKNERSRDDMEFEEEEDPEDQASGSVLSRFFQSFSGRLSHPTEQAGCQCTRADCYCSKATQCVNNPDVATSTAACGCTATNTSCCRGMPCLCAKKSQDQAYYNKKIDEEISEWLKDVPVTSIEDSESKKRRETIIKELRKTLKQLPDDENFEENAANEIQGFVDDIPLWNPGKDENDEKLFKNQLADKLTEKIIAVPRKPDRFRDIVRKWVANLDFEDDGEEVDMEAIIDNFVNRLKSLAADRPACDVKYTNILRKEIIELLVELALKFNGDMIMLKKVANNLAKEIVSIPRNVNLTGDTSDLTSEFEDKIADWICEHGLCKELMRDPKLIEGLAKKLNKLKSQGIYDDDVIEKMKEEVQQFVDDVGLAFETIDELIEELMKQLSSTIQLKEKESLDQEELIEEVSNWLRSLPGDSDLHPRKLERITKDLVKIIQDNNDQENENLANDVVYYLVDTELNIDSADLGIYVEELMEKLKILPSDKFYKEQAKRMMLKDIYEIIKCSPIPEVKKEKMRSRAQKIVELNLRKSSLNLRHTSDSVKETLLQEMDDAVSDIDIPKESRSKLKSLLSTSINRNFEKSFTRLSREQSDLKQTIAKDVRNVVKELPIDADKKKDLMQQVKGSLSKHMNKPLPSDVKDKINDGISEIVEKCPICEDRNVLGRIKKVLSEVASKHLTIYLPPCVCDIQNEVEEDVSIVIDRSSIDTGRKRELKESIQDILTENEDRRLSDEVVRTIKDDINSVVSELSIPQDKKDDLKKAVDETISKDFDEASRAFRHDLNKIRNKLLDDITNVIEKSPIQREVKSHMKDKLNTVLAKNLDSSLSDEEKHKILDDVSNIVRDDMTEEKRLSLAHKLAKKLDTQPSTEEKNGLIETINRLSIDSNTKDDMKKEIKAIFLETLYNPLSDDVQKQIEEDVMNAINQLDIPEHDKNNLKSNISHAIPKELDKLIAQDKEVPQIKTALEKIITNEIKKSPISIDEQEVLKNRIKLVLTENLVRTVTDEVKETIRERIGHIVDDLITDKGKADTIKTQLVTVVNKDFTKSAQPRRRIRSNENLRDQKQTMDLKDTVNKTVDNIVLETERAIDEASVTREKKNELKKKLKQTVIKIFEKPFYDDAEELKDVINQIFDELNLPKDKKNKLKSALLTEVGEYTSNLQTTGEDKDTEYSAKKRRPNEDNTYNKIVKGLTPIEEVDETKVKDSILKGIDKHIEESAIPEGKKMDLKRKLKILTAENLKKPFSQDEQDSIKTGIAAIIDDLPISKSEKIKLKSGLTSMVYENMYSLRDKPRDQIDHSDELEDIALDNILREMERTIKEAPTEKKIESKKLKDETKVKDSIFQGIEKIIEESAVPEGKKSELKRKLKTLAAENFKKPLSENVQYNIKTATIIADIIDDLPIPKSEKNKLKTELTSMVNENMDKLRRKTRDQVDHLIKSEDKPLHNIFQEMDHAIEEASVPRKKKIELKKKLKNLATKDFKKIPKEDVAETLKDDINEIIDELSISKDRKNKLKNILLAAVGEYMSNLQTAIEDKDTEYPAKKRRPNEDNTYNKIVKGLTPIEEVDETKVKDSILKGIDKHIEESAIPEGKKTELKRKLKILTAENLKKPFSQDVQDTIKTGIADIIDDLPMSKSEKNKLKIALTNIVDENIDNSRGVPRIVRTQVDYLKESDDKPLHNIFHEMDRAIEEASISKKKKIELKKKLMNLASKDFNKIPSEDVAEELEDNMVEILDELNLPKDKKNKLKSALFTAAGEYASNLQTTRENKESEYPAKKRRPNGVDTYNKIDKGLKPIHEVNATKVKDNILKGTEKIIEELAISKEKKVELKRKLKKVAAENLKKPFSQNVQDTTKTGIAAIIDDLQLSNSEKNKLKSELTSIFNENMDKLRSKPRDQIDYSEELEDKPLHNIFQEMELAIKEASVPKEKKLELKKMLQDLATKDFDSKSLDEVAEALKDGMIEIIDDLNLPKDKKNNLESTLKNMIDENMDILRDEPSEPPAQVNNLNELEDDTQRIILQGFEKVIDEAPMPKENKLELKKILIDIAKKNFKKPLSDEVAEALKDDTNLIIDELNLPNDIKHNMKNALTAVVDENMSNYKNENKMTKSSRYQLISPEKRRKISYPRHIIDESNLKESIKEEVKKSILQSKIAGSKKSRLNLDLLRMISGMLAEFDEAVDERMKYLFDKYGIKPNYQKTLAEEFDKLLEIALKGGDFDDARRKLIAKLMRDLNFSEEVACALTDEMIEKAREMARKEGAEDILKARSKVLNDRSHEVIPAPKLRPNVQEQKDEIAKYKDVFAKAINNAVDQSTVSKPDKKSLKNKLLNKLKQTFDESPNKNDIGALTAEVLQECKKIVDASSIPTGKKKEMKLLLKKELAEAFGDEIIDDEESSDDGEDDSVREESALQESPTPEEYKEKIKECIKTWMDGLPINFDPEVVTAVAEDLASDILDRQKYLQAHPEAIWADNVEIENLKYQVFRRMNHDVDPKDMPLIMERTEELYRMIMGIEPPEGVPKLRQTSSRGQSSSKKRRRDQAPSDTGNTNYSLKELIATNKSVRRQWSKHLENVISKLPLIRSETKDLKDKLAIYDETGQINILSALSRNKEETNSAESSKSSKQVAPKSALKIDNGKTSARLSKIEEAFAFNNTSKQKSPFTPKSNEPADVKEFIKKLKDTINTWLKKARVDIGQNEKNRILEELANDIIDRQKYLQTFGETPTRNENLEYLKLQIHRRLNGLVPVEVLKQIIENTKDLVLQIDKVKVPELGQVPQKTSSPKQRKLGPADILGIRSKATNTTTADGVPHTTDDDDGVEEDSDTEFNPGQASTPSKSAAEQQEAADAEYFDKVMESLTNWLESMPIDLDAEVKEDVINELVTDIVDRQKYLQVHPDKKFSDDEEIENLRFQVFKRLDKVLEPDSIVTPSLAKIEELYKMIAGDGRKKSLTAKQAQEFQTALNEEISALLNNYHICCDKRELLPKLANELTKLRKSGADQDEIVENLIATIQPLTYLNDEDAEELAYKLLYRTKKLISTIRGDVPVKKKDFREAMMKDIGDVFEGCPMSQSKRRLMESQLAEGYAKDLGIPLEESNASMNETGPDSKRASYGMSFNGLSNFIDTWLSSIHSDEDDSKDEDEIMDEKRERMYCLVHKIGEMNVDPEIFNDDSLYEAVLREELQQLLGDIKIDEEEFQVLKEDLIEKVLEAQRRAHDEIAGQNYKKNLRDTMSKLLPDQRNMSKEDQATIETLKDQLADAYIDLHYSGNNENQRDQLKRKITNELNTFCKDYLNRNPCSPLNSKTLNHQLYSALNKVPLPPGDSIRYEVEQARIREEINDWVKELPLQPQSPTELLARNKLIYVLSKKLFDIEVEKQEEDADNELMRKEIVKFLNKLPLESEGENDAIADTFIDKLKASEESRKYNATSNVTIDASGNVSAASNESSVKASVCPGYKWLFDKQKPCTPRKVCARHPRRQFESYPPCTLSPEDRAHLEKIRRRTCLSPSCVTSLINKHKCLPEAGPPPVDAGSQTVLRPFGIEDQSQKNRVCPFAYEKMPKQCPKVSPNSSHQPCPQGKTESVETEKPQPSSICPAAFEKAPRICPTGTSRSPQAGPQIRRHTISSSNISDCNEDIQTNIPIKQYYWDPSDKNSVDNSEQQQSGRSSRRLSDAAPCHPPGPPPCHLPRPAPCRPAPCASPKPSPCSPPRPATCRPAPCTYPRPGTCRPPPCPPPRPPGCHPPGPCDPSPPCFSQPTPPCRRPSSGKLKQQSSPQPKSPRQNSSERYSHCDPHSSFQRSSHRDIPSSRSPCSPSPCMSSFGQYTPPGSPSFSKRFNECRMPKRDGLQDQVPSTSSRPSQKERVIELGSLDDVNARPKKRPNDHSDWPKFHEDDNFWAVPMRRVILDEGIDESVVMERERREERVTCRCKERLVPKSGRNQPGNCPSQPFSQSNEDGQNLTRCSKCCGIHCPYPSFLYFRQ